MIRKEVRQHLTFYFAANNFTSKPLGRNGKRKNSNHVADKDQDFSGVAVKALDIVQTMINQQIPLRFIASRRLSGVMPLNKKSRHQDGSDF